MPRLPRAPRAPSLPSRGGSEAPGARSPAGGSGAGWGRGRLSCRLPLARSGQARSRAPRGAARPWERPARPGPCPCCAAGRAGRAQRRPQGRSRPRLAEGPGAALSPPPTPPPPPPPCWARALGPRGCEEHARGGGARGLGLRVPGTWAGPRGRDRAGAGLRGAGPEGAGPGLPRSGGGGAGLGPGGRGSPPAPSQPSPPAGGTPRPAAEPPGAPEPEASPAGRPGGGAGRPLLRGGRSRGCAWHCGGRCCGGGGTCTWLWGAAEAPPGYGRGGAPCAPPVRERPRAAGPVAGRPPRPPGSRGAAVPWPRGLRTPWEPPGARVGGSGSPPPQPAPGWSRPAASLQPRRGRSRPRPPALPRQPEEEAEAAAAGRLRRDREREPDGSGARRSPGGRGRGWAAAAARYGGGGALPGGGGSAPACGSASGAGPAAHPCAEHRAGPRGRHPRPCPLLPGARGPPRSAPSPLAGGGPAAPGAGPGSGEGGVRLSRGCWRRGPRRSLRAPSGGNGCPAARLRGGETESRGGQGPVPPAPPPALRPCWGRGSRTPRQPREPPGAAGRLPSRGPPRSGGDRGRRGWEKQRSWDPAEPSPVPVCPPPGRDVPCRRDGQPGDRPPLTCPSPPAVWDSSPMSGKPRRSGRGLLEEKRWQSLEERGSAGTRPGHPVLTRWVLHLTGDASPRPSPHLPPVRHGRAPRVLARVGGAMPTRVHGRAHPCLLLPARSKTCDPSFCQETEQAAAGRKGHPSPSVSLRAVVPAGCSLQGGCQGRARPGFVAVWGGGCPWCQGSAPSTLPCQAHAPASPTAEQACRRLPQSLRGARRAGSAAGLLLLRLAEGSALPRPPLHLLLPRLLSLQPPAQGHQGGLGMDAGAVALVGGHGQQPGPR